MVKLVSIVHCFLHSKANQQIVSCSRHRAFWTRSRQIPQHSWCWMPQLKSVSSKCNLVLKLLKIRTPTREAKLEYLIWRNGFIVESSFLIDYDPLPPISFTATPSIGPITFLWRGGMARWHCLIATEKTFSAELVEVKEADWCVPIWHSSTSCSSGPDLRTINAANPHCKVQLMSTSDKVGKHLNQRPSWLCAVRGLHGIWMKLPFLYGHRTDSLNGMSC